MLLISKKHFRTLELQSLIYSSKNFVVIFYIIFTFLTNATQTLIKCVLAMNSNLLIN